MCLCGVGLFLGYLTEDGGCWDFYFVVLFFRVPRGESLGTKVFCELDGWRWSIDCLVVKSCSKSKRGQYESTAPFRFLREPRDRKSVV